MLSHCCCCCWKNCMNSYSPKIMPALLLLASCQMIVPEKREVSPRVNNAPDTTGYVEEIQSAALALTILNSVLSLPGIRNESTKNPNNPIIAAAMMLHNFKDPSLQEGGNPGDKNTITGTGSLGSSCTSPSKGLVLASALFRKPEPTPKLIAINILPGNATNEEYKVLKKKRD